MRTKTSLQLLLSALTALAACATAAPPKELMDARAAVIKAENGAAKAYRPDQLHEAQVALDQAERAYAANGGDDRTTTLAYLAERYAETAEADGVTSEATEHKQQATAELTQAATADLQRTRHELNRTREELASETQARQELERKAQDALNRLMLASVPVKQEPRGTVITLPGSVLFASGKSSLLTSGQQKLAQVAAVLKDQPDKAIAVEGHTDSRGSDELNQALSERRAETVKSFLVAQGVAGEHIDAVGLGASVPVADNATAEGRADNRRVEIIVKPPPEPQ